MLWMDQVGASRVGSWRNLGARSPEMGSDSALRCRKPTLLTNVSLTLDVFSRAFCAESGHKDLV